MNAKELALVNRNTMKLQDHLYKVLKQRDQFQSERDTLIEDLTWYKAKVDRLERELKKKHEDADRLGYRWRDSHDKTKRLEHENARLTRLTHKLTIHRIMWHALKDWRRDMLEIDKNDTQLIGLGLVMDELEKRYLYKGRADDER